MQRLGMSLNSLNRTNRYSKFSLECIAQIGFDVLKQIENLHDKGFLHADIKTDNILVRYSMTNNRRIIRRSDLKKNIYLIDFGCS